MGGRVPENVKIPDDAEITELFFRRSEDALRQTETKYGKLFFTVAAGITGNYEDAAECVNDTYLRLWNSIPPERPVNLKAYGVTVVRNFALNRVEHDRAGKRGGGEILAELDESIPDSSQNAADTGELAALVDAFLRAQNRKNRAVFILRYWHCESLEDIAEKCGCSVQSVKSGLCRTRKKLKTYLEKEGVSL